MIEELLLTSVGLWIPSKAVPDLLAESYAPGHQHQVLVDVSPYPAGEDKLRELLGGYRWLTDTLAKNERIPMGQDPYLDMVRASGSLFELALRDLVNSHPYYVAALKRAVGLLPQQIRDGDKALGLLRTGTGKNEAMPVPGVDDLNRAIVAHRIMASAILDFVVDDD